MRYYCTYFDTNYLTRGLALHGSLVAHAGEFELVVLCMDEAVEATLRGKKLPGVRLLPVAELIALYPALAAALADRTKLEFYFTCTSWLMRHLLPQIPAGELLTYLDADLYFFSSPQPIYDEIGSASIAITPHRFPASLAHLARYGKFNVGWVSLRHNATGLACAADWAEKCADWCFSLLEADRYADQKYLDAWTTQFPGTVSLTNPGVNVAPWNIKDCTITAGTQGVRINKRPLIFYHFHALTHLDQQLYDPGLHKYDATLTPGLREQVYLPYLRLLQAGTKPAAERRTWSRPPGPTIPAAGRRSSGCSGSCARLSWTGRPASWPSRKTRLPRCAPSRNCAWPPRKPGASPRKAPTTCAWWKRTARSRSSSSGPTPRRPWPICTRWRRTARSASNPSIFSRTSSRPPMPIMSTMWPT